MTANKMSPEGERPWTRTFATPECSRGYGQSSLNVNDTAFVQHSRHVRLDSGGDGGVDEERESGRRRSNR
jgi:hypothetical protein